MSRSTHPCLTCPTGRTRHKPPVCTACRDRGVRVEGDTIHVPIVMNTDRVRVAVVDPANPAAPTVAELAQGTDVSHLLVEPKKLARDPEVVKAQLREWIHAEKARRAQEHVRRQASGLFKP